jgi:hypothetical protein
MRSSVHSSVPKPWSVGLSMSIRPRACNCCPSKRAGRPREGMARSASMPPSSSTAFQVYAVCRATPIACAACAGVLPARSNRPARKRRRTVASNRFVTMHRTQYLPSIGAAVHLVAHSRFFANAWPRVRGRKAQSCCSTGSLQAPPRMETISAVGYRSICSIPISPGVLSIDLVSNSKERSPSG